MLCYNGLFAFRSAEALFSNAGRGFTEIWSQHSQGIFIANFDHMYMGTGTGWCSNLICMYVTRVKLAFTH